MVGSVRPKRIYFALRHPQWQGDTFVQRWRQHGQLAMRFMAEQSWANVDRYVHGDRIHLQGFPSSGVAYDGMGMVFFKSVQSRQQHLANPQSRQILLADEDDTFAHRVNQHGMVCQEDWVMGVRNSSVKWVQIYKAKPGASLKDLDEMLRAHRETLLSHPHSGIDAWMENRPLAPESDAGWGLSADVIVEMGFQSTDAVRNLIDRQIHQLVNGVDPRLASCTLNLLVTDICLKG